MIGNTLKRPIIAKTFILALTWERKRNRTHTLSHTHTYTHPISKKPQSAVKVLFFLIKMFLTIITALGTGKLEY